MTADYIFLEENSVPKIAWLGVGGVGKSQHGPWSIIVLNTRL